MASALETIEEAILEIARARRMVSRINAKQVRRSEDLSLLKSTAHAWFRTHRDIVTAHRPTPDLSRVDQYYKTILDSTCKFAAKETYAAALKRTKAELVALRGEVLTERVRDTPGDGIHDPPDFSALAGSVEMQRILTRRWAECQRCVGADAHLAAIVMMGGLLEALFVARANKMDDKAPLINSKGAPRDRGTGKTTNYQDWMLDSYIRVARELNWISQSAKDVADVLKDYRNYIHPEKERRHGVTLDFNDSSIFWEVTKPLIRQLLASASPA